MSLDDWVLALHMLSAFAYGAGIVLFWALVVAVRGTDTADRTVRMEPAVKVGNVAVGIGAGGVIVFGIWLALSVGGYDVWDGWIIAAIVLWLVSVEAGRRTGDAYMNGMRKAQQLQAAGQPAPSAELLALNRTSTGLALHTLSTVVFILLLADMIWKPGA
ncbi:MAG TPA: hypothetical protein VFR32_07860 [Gaiellaceae bacterium]|nr:hypothetical protein [Gaiellaceae bacterium]